MTFDNDISPSPSAGSQLRSHLPLFLIAGGAAAAFISLHTAATTVAGLAGLHIVAGLAIVAFRRHRTASVAE